jgi:hypothetical protein
MAAGMTKKVAFEPIEKPINDFIDEAYRKKYRGSPYLRPMIGARALRHPLPSPVDRLGRIAHGLT